MYHELANLADMTENKRKRNEKPIQPCAFLSPKEVGQKLGIAERTVVGLFRDGVIPGKQLRPKGRIFIPASVVNEMAGAG